jgi:hypothetical protein
MPVFEYTALDSKGKTTSGIIDAEGPQVARQKLRTSGIFPISIRETLEAAPKKASKEFSLTRRLGRVKPVEVSMMTRQLATLIGAGFPLVSALDALVPQTKSHGFKKILAQIKELIVEGNSFAQALSKYPGAFSPLYVNMVRAGETSGTLEIVLERLADIRRFHKPGSKKVYFECPHDLKLIQRNKMYEFTKSIKSMTRTLEESDKKLAKEDNKKAQDIRRWLGEWKNACGKLNLVAGFMEKVMELKK